MKLNWIQNFFPKVIFFFFFNFKMKYKNLSEEVDLIDESFVFC